MARRRRNAKQLAFQGESDRAQSARIMTQLRQDSQRIANQFKLKYRELRAEKVGVNGHYGICYDNGTIRIRLRHAKTGKLLRYSSLINTLCHELAHLKYFDHSDEFKHFYFKLLYWAKDQGIYCPATQTSPQPACQNRMPKIRQLSLF